jgi:hypothetical protein
LILLHSQLPSVLHAETPAEVVLKPDFRGQFESHDISSSGKWILEFKFENGQWSGQTKISSGHWVKIEDVKVNGNTIEFHINSDPVSKFRGEIDSKNDLISGVQEIGDGRKNTFNNLFLPYTATRIR